MKKENQSRKDSGYNPLTKKQVEKAKKVAGDFLIKEIHKHLDKGTTPVKDGSYKKYLKGGKKISKLLDEGDMRSHIKRKVRKSGVEVGIFRTAPKIERLKASGHNFGDAAHGVQREFIPMKGKFFTETIIKKMNRAVKEVFRTAPKKRDRSTREEETGEIETVSDIFSDKFLDSIIMEAVKSKVSQGLSAGTIKPGATVSVSTGVSYPTESFTAATIFADYKGIEDGEE